MATKKTTPRTPHHCVYVIELDPTILREKRFAAANPNARDDKPCLYFGLIGLTPERKRGFAVWQN